jgi:hypothetical protein
MEKTILRNSLTVRENGFFARLARDVKILVNLK